MHKALHFVALILPFGLALAQSSDEPTKFEAADVQVAAKSSMPFFRNPPVHNGRYEIKNATMVDLIRTAYGFDSDKIFGGPNWLEMDRFDVTGKVPHGSNPESQKQMLQAVLEDRFKLAIHKENKPLPTYALVQGKKHQLKEATGQESAGCKPQAPSGPPGEGRGQLMMSGPNGTTQTFSLGPGMTVQFNCRNMTMEAFVANLRTMIGANIGTNPILEETGLKGAWNFDLKYSLTLNGMLGGGSEQRVSLVEAIDKQLGLKLEERQVPTPVIVVDKVNQKPTPNPPETAEALPPLPVPTEFEVASVKLSEPVGTGPRMMRSQTQPGGRFTVDGMPLRFLVTRAFNVMTNNEYVQGLPKFADEDRFDIAAKAPPSAGSILDMDTVSVLLRALLVDRFKIKYHTEERPVTAYTLVSAKPKLKKADPNSRSWCKFPSNPPGTPPGSRVFQCQNVTMDQFAERLQGMGPDLNWPVVNGTELEGGWDFSLTYSMGMPMMMGGRGAPDSAGAGANPAVPTASEPTGGYTLMEAIEKQLGFKLEKQKRNMPVIVIDHIEPKPTDN